MPKQNKKRIEEEAKRVAEEGTEWRAYRFEMVALKVLQGLLSSGAVLKAYDSDEIVRASVNYARLFIKEIDNVDKV